MRRGDPAIASAARAMLRSWRFRGWAIAMAIVGIVLVRLPLFDVLGYEQALVVGVVMSIAGLDLGAAFARRAAAIEAPALARAVGPWRLVAQLAWRAQAIAAVIAIIPGAIAAARGLWVPTCDWGFGLRAYALLPVATAVIAAAAGAAIGLAVDRWWLRGLALAGLWLAVAAAGAWRFYSEPPVFSYDPILGYFPGNLYDEDISLGWPLVWARLEQLCAVGAMLALAAAWLDAPSLRVRWRARRPSGFRTAELVACALFAAGAGALHWQAGRLGYAIDADDILAELDATRETPHFVIHYTARPDIEADMDLIAADHEFRYAQVVATLGVEASGKIDSFYFADSDQKARLMGARSVEMAKPWQRAIYLDHRGFPAPSLRHEIAHVVAGEFGDAWFRVCVRRVLGVPVGFKPGLIEGLAVATDWPGNYDAPLTPHQAVRVLSMNGMQPAIDDILAFGFFSASAARSYTTGGSFVRFLYERYGAAPLERLYASGGDFEGAYGKRAIDLEAEWRAMIDAIVVPTDAVATGKETYRRGSLFELPCPHAIAAREQAASARAAAGDRAGAIALLRQVCADDPDEPHHRMLLAATLAGGEPPDPHQVAEARTIFAAIADDQDGVTPPVRVKALIRLGGMAATDGDLAAAEGFFTRAAALPADPDDQRVLEGIRLALHHEGPAAPVLRGYFFGTGDKLAWASSITILEPALGLGWYLRGFQEVARGDHAHAAGDLARALELGLPPRFTAAAARKLAVSAWRAGDHANVARAADALAATGNEVERLLADDWRQRIDWAVTGRISSSHAAEK